jgi:transposase
MDTANGPNRPSTPPSTVDRPFTPPIAAASDTTRDQRLQVQTLHDTGFTYTQIRERLGLTLRQVQYAVRHRVTPKKRSGRPGMLTQEEVDHIVIWVCAMKGNRRTPWAKIPMILELNVSRSAIRTALRNAGFSRRVARRKPPISERNQLARLQFAIEHANWTIEEWKKIFWSDET